MPVSVIPLLVPRAGGRPPFSSSARALLLVALLTACQSMPAQTATDLRRLQGHWQGIGPGGECSVIISGNSLVYVQPSGDASTEFRYETTFTLPAATGPKQLHATIVRNHWPDQAGVGKVVVTIFEVEDEALTLGVVNDFDGPPAEPVVGDWDRVSDLYNLERAEPRESQPQEQLPADL